MKTSKSPSKDIMYGTLTCDINKTEISSHYVQEKDKKNKLNCGKCYQINV